MQLVGRRIEIRGTVQGVGFRPWVFRLAHEEGISGRIRNGTQGVTIEAFGEEPAVQSFLARLRQTAPPAARIGELHTTDIPAESPSGFLILESRDDGPRRVSIPPDLATCDDCLREVSDPSDRRFRYPFTNCTACGPRFTILRRVPYDRPSTSMAEFAMCDACLSEYRDPSSRRFHAQPNACPDCGPRLRALSPRHEPMPASDPLRAAAAFLEAGLIVAVKGLGGFHLACDATSSMAVGRLRRRKQRDHKPFAVMVKSLAAAEKLALLDDDERLLLVSVERPIVLVHRHPRAELAPEVAPDNPLVGLMLAYTPLHHLLLDDVDRPLVMTSGNLADEPIATRDRDAWEHLGGVADLLLVHDRPIESRCDDSVARIVAGRPMVLRRSRGFVPRPVALRRAVERPVLACGGHLKNTFCVATGDAAWIGPHVGDLENLETVEAFEEAVERLLKLLGVTPEVVAHDLHPGYLTTSWAQARPGLKIGVQHHHAHVASLMAEKSLTGPVIGVAYDGTGYGSDGGIWGGEILLVGDGTFDRLATLRPLPLPGADTAIRNVWRLALSALHDTFDGGFDPADFAFFRHVARREMDAVRAILPDGAVCPPAHGLGRWFDAIGALVLGRAVSHHEGEVALLWNLVADATEHGRYPFVIEPASGAPHVLDLRPLVRSVVDDLRAGCDAATISGRFHNTVAAGTAEMIRYVVRQVGRHPVLLSGGCFQNALLAERLQAELGGELDVHLHEQVPPGDGGLALGQAVVADAITRSGTSVVAAR